TLSSEMRRLMDAFTKPLADAIVTAGQGDRPLTFAAGRIVYDAVAALYPTLDEIERSSSAFETIVEIEGLNEFYREHAQIDLLGPVVFESVPGALKVALGVSRNMLAAISEIGAEKVRKEALSFIADLDRVAPGLTPTTLPTSAQVDAARRSFQSRKK